VRYLPAATAFALRNVMAVLAPENRRITASKMTDAQPSTLKSADIVYIGFMSGVVTMENLVFTSSRFAVGMPIRCCPSKRCSRSLRLTA